MIADQASIAPKQVEAQIQDIVRSAAGIDSERMDEVVVTALPFAQQQYVAASVAPAADISSDEVLAYGPYAVALLALFLTFWFVVRPMMRTALPSAQQMAMRNARATTGDETSSDLATRLKRLVDNYQPVDANDLNRLVNEQSQASAAVLRRWNTN
jgi:flagellar biosynthesis/type III secretory pathway M-ring protein FliF/YscJ